MGIQFYQNPGLNNPVLIACWPGLGSIGAIVGDNLVKRMQAEELAEIESWDFFYPQRAVFKSGVLETLEFPSAKFYFQKLAKKDVIIFIGQEEPNFQEGFYLSTRKSFEIGNLILDVAEKFGCRRIYTSCAAISANHHDFRSRVWGVVSHDRLKSEVKGYPNTNLMSEVDGQRYGRIPGLKGLLLGLAEKRGLDAICLRGEIPDYVARFPIPYPRAARAVLEVLVGFLGIDFDYKEVDQMNEHMKQVVDELLENFPPDIRERIAQRKSALQANPETITEEDENWIKQHIDELFKKGGG